MPGRPALALIGKHVPAVLLEERVIVSFVGVISVVPGRRRRSVRKVVVRVDRTDGTNTGLVARRAGRTFVEVHVEEAVAEDRDGVNARSVTVLDNAGTGLLLGEENVLLRVELVDALHRTHVDTHVDTRAVLHIDTCFGDDRDARQATLLPTSSDTAALLVERPATD